MKLDAANYRELFEGYLLVDCVVRSPEILYFILEQAWDEDMDWRLKSGLQTRIVGYFDEPGDPGWDKVDMTGIHRMQAGVSYVPKEQFIGVSLNDQVYAWGSGDAALEDQLEGGRAATGRDIGMRGGVSKLRTIAGTLWLAGSGRTVGQRLGRNAWFWHDAIPYRSLMDDGGFRDLDGFTQSDIYAVGGQGDVWHFDGANWQPLAFPSDMTLETVCCGGDGEVYIGAASGTLFKGCHNHWKTIEHGVTQPFRDMVWYQDRLWCTCDQGVWTLEGDSLGRADIPHDVRVCAGHLSVGAGALLVAGHGGAALHDGETWQRLINFADFN
ncbi:MAG: hypothetical protein ABWY06_16820 [Pseudomonas sp.]|uniref:hypothetical protein n=1 Tax=Pseudomonas sp. TaxID=306 RepID=UPI003394372A